MAIFKLIDNAIDSNEKLLNACNYIADTKKSKGELIGYRNLCSWNFYEEIKSMQEFYGKDYGRRAYHFVVSFDDGEPLMPTDAFDLAYDLSDYFSGEYQIIYAVHTEQKHLHIHFLLNTVSFETGRKYHFDYKKQSDFNNYIGKTLLHYTA